MSRDTRRIVVRPGSLGAEVRAAGSLTEAIRVPLLVLGLLALLLGLSACQVVPGQSGAADGPRLAFQERSYDLGQVSASQKTAYRFAFTNTGSRPLEIGDIRLEPARPGG